MVSFEMMHRTYRVTNESCSVVSHIPDHGMHVRYRLCRAVRNHARFRNVRPVNYDKSTVCMSMRGTRILYCRCQQTLPRLSTIRARTRRTP